MSADRRFSYSISTGCGGYEVRDSRPVDDHPSFSQNRRPRWFSANTRNQIRSTPTGYVATSASYSSAANPVPQVSTAVPK